MKHPYRTTYNLLKERYGQKLRKICVDGGFTCPNRDGTCGTGGCSFCGERGAGEQLDPAKSIREQVQARLDNAPADSMWIVYFQNFTNTYASPEVLRARYDAALFDGRIRILDIGTRPDCITPEICALLAEYAKKREVWVELGLQTANDETARAFGRGYGFACFSRAMEMLRAYGLSVTVHMILGLPGETKEDMLRTAEEICAHGAEGIKLHSLFVMKGTRLAEDYLRGSFRPISMEEYIDCAVAVLAHLDPNITVHRVTGNCLREYLLAPDWILLRDRIITGIDRKMAEEGLTQGCLFRDGRTGHEGCFV